MKKTVKTISLLAFVLLLSACGDNIATQETSDSLTLESEYIAENAQLSEDNESQTVALEINTSDWVLADSMIYVPSDWYHHWDPWGTQFFDTDLPDNTTIRVERQLIPRMYFEIRLDSIHTSDFLFDDGQMGEFIETRELVAWLYDEETAFIFWHRGNLNYFTDNCEILATIAKTFMPTSENVESYFEQNVVESDLVGQWVVTPSLSGASTKAKYVPTATARERMGEWSCLLFSNALSFGSWIAFQVIKFHRMVEYCANLVMQGFEICCGKWFATFTFHVHHFVLPLNDVFGGNVAHALVAEIR